MDRYPNPPEVAAIVYRRLQFVARLVPPWRPPRVAPEGFCAGGDLWKTALRNAASWGLPLSLQSVPGHRRVAELIGGAAASGNIRTAAQLAWTGRRVWLPPEAWLATGVYGQTAVPAERAAVQGQLLRTPTGELYEPIVALHDLARLLEAVHPPAPPSVEVTSKFEAWDLPWMSGIGAPNAGPDVAAEGRYGCEPKSAAPVRLMTGAPGRPSTMAWVCNRFRERAIAGESLATVTEEAIALCQMCVAECPAGPNPTAKTIRNRIAHAYRRLRADGTIPPAVAECRSGLMAA